jgi:hypothetical protein
VADITLDLEGDVAKVVDALAGAIRDGFRDNVHVLTGAMQASSALITSSGSDYAQCVAAAAALNPAADFADEAPVSDGQAIVQVAVGYAAHEEFGTVRRPAHPALIPAVEAVVSGADAIARRALGI